jgi:DNA relaxase NicK
MSDSTGVVIESQVDWLTVSAHGEKSADRLLDLGHSLAEVERELGNKRKPWRTMGYDGTHVGRVEFGQRDSASTILRLIGQLAEDQLGVALSVSDQATRIDLAATWRATPADPYIGPNAYSLATMRYEANKRRALPSQTSDGAKGYTMKLGVRTSDNYFRLYNKETECIALGDKPGAARYKDCWRFELEMKGGNVRKVAETAFDLEDRAAYVQSYLHQYCEAHGLQPPFDDDGGRVLLPGFRRRSDADSRLAHLEKNVRPTIDWLRDQGRLEAALDALGLSSAD